MTGILDAESPAIIGDALLFTAYLEALDADPLRSYRPACPVVEELIAALHHQIEVWWQASNSAGKTTSICALDVALARGLKSLNGIPVPPIAVPNVGWILTQSYKQQVDSSQKALLQWLGKWPHKISYVSGEAKGYIETVHVATEKCKHGMDERCSTCSRIVFHCAESNSAIGGRIDWAHADEIPPMHVWREVRARFQAGRPFYRYLTATPLWRRDWAPLLEDFKACEGVAVEGRLRLRSSIYDNRYLSPEQIKVVVESWLGDPLFDARVQGECVDTEGDCPFDQERLKQWRVRCTPPTLETFTIMAERTTEAGRIVEPRLARVECWGPVEESESYVLVADPSTGVRSRTHDPAGFQVWARRSRTLKARFDDYLEPYGLGYLAGLVAERYNVALVDVDMTGGYGGPTITALANLRYSNINRDYHEAKPGRVGGQLGFRISAENRSEITSAIQRALADETVIVPSEAVVSCLLGCTVDDRGKYLAAPGRHDEDMICMGRALHLMDTMGRPAARIKTAEERIEALLNVSGVALPGVTPEEHDEGGDWWGRESA